MGEPRRRRLRGDGGLGTSVRHVAREQGQLRAGDGSSLLSACGPLYLSLLCRLDSLMKLAFNFYPFFLLPFTRDGARFYLGTVFPWFGCHW